MHDTLDCVTRRTAGISADADSHSLFISRVDERIGLIFAAAAVVCWYIATYRQEPGSSFWIVLLFATYGLSFFILV